MKKDVFISYARKDYINPETKGIIPDSIITKIKEILEKNGITFWFDEEGIYSGDAFAPVIAKNIKEAKIFLFISSKSSNDSEWTAGEVATAHMYGKKIIPVKIDESNYNESVILHLAHLDYIDYSSHPSKALDRMIESIQGFLAEEEKRLKEQEALKHSEALKIEKANALKQVRERMEGIRIQRENIFSKLQAVEAEAIQVRQELDLVDAGYNELRNQEARLLDDDFEQRMRKVTVTDGNTVNAGTSTTSQSKTRYFVMCVILCALMLLQTIILIKFSNLNNDYKIKIDTLEKQLEHKSVPKTERYKSSSKQINEVPNGIGKEKPTNNKSKFKIPNFPNNSVQNSNKPLKER